MKHPFFGKLIVAVLILAMVIGMVSAVGAESASPFADVADPNAYYYDAVLWAVNAQPKITVGTSDTTFSPYATCTRGQVVTFLWRANGEPEPTAQDTLFTDVKAGAYYEKAVLWAVKKEITKGTSATTFSPNQSCTRGQVATFLWRANGEPDASDAPNPFNDVKEGAFYEKAVLWAVENGITNGTGATTFSPNATCTRAQIVTFLYRDLAEEPPVEPTEEPSEPTEAPTEPTEAPEEPDCYLAHFGAQETSDRTTYAAFLKQQGFFDRMGIEQDDTLKLNDDGSFELTKRMHGTLEVPGMTDPIDVSYTFTGTYERTGNQAVLSEAAHATGSVTWGTLGDYMGQYLPAAGKFDSSFAPGILSYYATGCFVDRAKNSAMEVTLNPADGTFTFAEFEPELLAPGEVGAIVPTQFHGLTAHFNAEQTAEKTTIAPFLKQQDFFNRMGIEQDDTLELNPDGSFELTKRMHGTLEVPGMTDPIDVSYTFTGTYETNGTAVTLSAAEAATGTVSWGTLGDYMGQYLPVSGKFESTTSPGILTFYATGCFVDRAKNAPMDVVIDTETNTFSFVEFTPELLQLNEVGAIVPLDPGDDPELPETEPGQMPAPLVEDMSLYSLKNTFAEHGMVVGTAISARSIREPYEEILLDQFSSVTLENNLKPQSTLSRELSQQTGKLTASFSSGTKQLLDWCKEHNMPLRGHTMIWYMGTPDWIFREGFTNDGAYVGREEMLQRMEDFIRSYFEELVNGGWAELMYCIDVVNEAIIAPDTLRDESLPWHQIIGDDYIWYAYSFARKYAPANIKLVYNDYDVEAKTDAVIALAKSLVDEDGNSLVDVIGHQGHYGPYGDIDTLAASLQRISDETGLELQITELDVNLSTRGTLEELKRQGQFYYNFVQAMWKLKENGVNLTGISLWGFADAIGWMPNNYMLLYDSNLVAKYSYFGMLGIKELAGFDLEDDDEEIGGYELRYAVEGDPSRYIQLYMDGSYVDTVTGTEITGIYRADGERLFILQPNVGSYVSLEISEDGLTAVRMEAAGQTIPLIKA